MNNNFERENTIAVGSVKIFEVDGLNTGHKNLSHEIFKFVTDATGPRCGWKVDHKNLVSVQNW